MFESNWKSDLGKLEDCTSTNRRQMKLLNELDRLDDALRTEVKSTFSSHVQAYPYGPGIRPSTLPREIPAKKVYQDIPE